MRTLKALFLILILFSAVGRPVGAEEHPSILPERSDCAQEVPVILDVLVLRPVGLAMCTLGLVAAVVALPFALPGDNVSKVYRHLIADPFEYTFKRPLGRDSVIECRPPAHPAPAGGKDGTVP
jgi:hypothetical protein